MLFTCKSRFIHHCCYLQEDALATGVVSVEGPLLEGHMNFAVELLTYHKPENKHFIGSKPGGMQLIEVRWVGLHILWDGYLFC